MIRRLLQRLHRFWFDGDGDEVGTDELFRAVRVMRHMLKRTGLIEDPQVRREFDEVERIERELRHERQGR